MSRAKTRTNKCDTAEYTMKCAAAIKVQTRVHVVRKGEVVVVNILHVLVGRDRRLSLFTYI